MKKIISTTFVSLIPLFAFAQTPQTPGLNKIGNLSDLSLRITTIINLVIYILMALAVLYIIWYVVMYFIRGKEGDENRSEAGKNVMWGIVGLAIILSIWGLVNILMNTFNTDTNAPVDEFPQANFIK